MPQALFFFQKNGPHIFGSPELVGTLPQALFFLRKMGPRFLTCLQAKKSPVHIGFRLISGFRLMSSRTFRLVLAGIVHNYAMSLCAPRDPKIMVLGIMGVLGSRRRSNGFLIRVHADRLIKSPSRAMATRFDPIFMFWLKQCVLVREHDIAAIRQRPCDNVTV